MFKNTLKATVLATLVTALILVVGLYAVASAQAQRGTITTTVTDDDGVVLPGAGSTTDSTALPVSNIGSSGEDGIRTEGETSVTNIGSSGQDGTSTGVVENQRHDREVTHNIDFKIDASADNTEGSVDLTPPSGGGPSATPGTETTDIGTPATTSVNEDQLEIQAILEEYDTRAGYSKIGDIKGETVDAPDSFFDIFTGTEATTHADSFFDIWTDTGEARDGVVNILDVVDVANTKEASNGTPDSFFDIVVDASALRATNRNSSLEIIHDLHIPTDFAEDVNTAEDFSLWLAGVGLKQERLDTIAVGPEGVGIVYGQPGRLFGVIPVHVPTALTVKLPDVDPDTGERMQKVTVQYSPTAAPWWDFLVFGKESEEETTSGNLARITIDIPAGTTYVAQNDWRGQAGFVNAIFEALGLTQPIEEEEEELQP